MRRIAWLISCTALLCLGVAAQAQMDTGEFGKDWDLRVGMFIPESGVARDAQGDVWFTVGAEHTLNYQERYRVTLSLDYYGSGDLYAVPILFNARGETNRLRYGAGIGVGMGSGTDGWSVGFAFNLMVGAYLTQGSNPIFADLRYMGTNISGLNGWALTVGKTF